MLSAMGIKTLAGQLYAQVTLALVTYREKVETHEELDLLIYLSRKGVS